MDNLEWYIALFVVFWIGFRYGYVKGETDTSNRYYKLIKDRNKLIDDIAKLYYEKYHRK